MRETSRGQDKELVDNHKVFINPERISPPDKRIVLNYSLSSVLETVRVKSLEMLGNLKALYTTT
jgi:hypothetical protein